MGCCFSRSEKDMDNEPATKVYSWDKKRAEVDPKDTILEELDDKTIIRYPGSINGRQFVINNCKNSTILLLDHIETITLDNCEKCVLIIGPVKSSIFLRNCSSCICMVACQQFRTRDCSKIETYLHCTTQPIIESSYKMKFGCYQLFYPELSSHIKAAGLQVFNNTWSKIYDFSPNPDAANWTLLPEDTKIEDKIDFAKFAFKEDSEQDKLNKTCLPENFKINFNHTESVVPITRGNRPKNHEEPCVVVLFHNDNIDATAVELISKLQEQNVDLISTKYRKVSAEKSETLFQAKKFIDCVESGPLIILEFDGENCVEKCNALQGTFGEDVVMYISNMDSATDDVEKFIYYTDDMQMN